MTNTEKVCEKNCPDFNGMSILHLEQCDCSCHPVLAKGEISAIAQAIAEERERVVKHVNKTLDRYVVKKEPLCEQNSLILLIRAHILSSLDKPLTDKE